jgi:hypothetical protein
MRAEGRRAHIPSREYELAPIGELRELRPRVGPVSRSRKSHVSSPLLKMSTIAENPARRMLRVCGSRDPHRKATMLSPSPENSKIALRFQSIAIWRTCGPGVTVTSAASPRLTRATS